MTVNYNMYFLKFVCVCHDEIKEKTDLSIGKIANKQQWDLRVLFIICAMS